MCRVSCSCCNRKCQPKHYLISWSGDKTYFCSLCVISIKESQKNLKRRLTITAPESTEKHPQIKKLPKKKKKRKKKRKKRETSVKKKKKKVKLITKSANVVINRVKDKKKLSQKRWKLNRKKRIDNAPGRGVTREDREWLLEFYGTTCLCCGKPGVTISTLDHVVPLCKDGRHDPDNLQNICWPCNKKKGLKVIDYRPKPYEDRP